MNKRFMIKSLLLLAMISGQCAFGSEEGRKGVRDSALFDDNSVIVYPIAFNSEASLFLPTTSTGKFYKFTGGKLEEQTLQDTSPVVFTKDVQRVLQDTFLQSQISDYKMTQDPTLFIFATKNDELMRGEMRIVWLGTSNSDASLPTLFEKFTKKSDEQGTDSPAIKRYACILEPQITESKSWDRVKYLGFIVLSGAIIWCLFKRGFFDQFGTFLSRG